MKAPLAKNNFGALRCYHNQHDAFSRDAFSRGAFSRDAGVVQLSRCIYSDYM